MFLTSANLLLPGVRHGFFTRKGGVSEGIYASLNCGQGSSDNPVHVMQNRRRVAEMLGADELCSVNQVHGRDAVRVELPWPHENRPSADAMVTTVPGIALGILAADCVPVLLADAQGAVIGAAHSGWKGATGGILESTVEAMESCGAARSRIAAAIGPSIAQASYEVDEARRIAIIGMDTACRGYFLPSRRPGHWMFDLKGLVFDRLARMGLGSINRLENDTCMEETAFFSFRRTTHRGEPDYGRQVSAIMLQKD